MSTCVYNEKRKGDRECPALGGKICSRCCGRERLKDIQCPEHCVWLQRGMRNHRKKYMDSGELFETSFWNWLDSENLTRSRKGDFAIAVFTIVHGYLKQQEEPENHVTEVDEAVEALKRKRTGSIVSVESTTNALARQLGEELDRMEEAVGDEDRWQDLESELIELIPSSREWSREQDESYPAFLREFFTRFYLPEYNPVEQNNLYIPGSGGEGRSRPQEGGSSIIT